MTHGLSESKVKVVVNHSLPAFPGKGLMLTGIKNGLVHVGKVVHPCRVKSFRKAVSTVMDDLETRFKDHREHEPNLKIWQVDQRVLKDASSWVRGGDPR